MFIIILGIQSCFSYVIITFVESGLSQRNPHFAWLLIQLRSLANENVPVLVMMLDYSFDSIVRA
jgi:hypothetical protein